MCWDNSAAESFFASLKNEMYYWETFATRARNRTRLHSTLGYRTPFEALTDYQAAAAAA